LFSLELGGDCRGDGVGIDVQEIARRVARQRAHDRHQRVVELLAQDIRVDRFDIPDKAIVDWLLAFPLHRWAAKRADQAGIDPAESDGGDAEITAGRKDAGVDLAIQDQRRHVERCATGDAPPLYEGRVEPERRGERCRLGGTAMHQHYTDADLAQDSDLFHQRPGAIQIGEYLAAYLEHEDLAFEEPNVRRRVLQRGDDDGPVVPRLHDVLPSIWCSTAICASIRFRASWITTLRGPSRTLSVTTTPRRTGRQCMKRQSVAAFSNQGSSTRQCSRTRLSSMSSTLFP